MTFLIPLHALIPKIPFSFFAAFWIWVEYRVTSEAQGSVSLGFWGSRQLSLFGGGWSSQGALSTPPPLNCNPSCPSRKSTGNHTRRRKILVGYTRIQVTVVWCLSPPGGWGEPSSFGWWGGDGHGGGGECHVGGVCALAGPYMNSAVARDSWVEVLKQSHATGGSLFQTVILSCKGRQPSWPLGGFSATRCAYKHPQPRQHTPNHSSPSNSYQPPTPSTPCPLATVLARFRATPPPSALYPFRLTYFVYPQPLPLPLHPPYALYRFCPLYRISACFPFQPLYPHYPNSKDA